MSRTENGSPAFKTLDGQEVVALDAVAKLAGLNPAAVSRVFAALELIAADKQRPVEELIRLDQIPLVAPDKARADATNSYWSELLLAGFENWPAGKERADYLRLVERDRAQH